VPSYLHISVLWESVDVTVPLCTLVTKEFFGNDDEDYNGGNNSTNKITNLSTSLLILIVSEMKMLWKSWLSLLLTKIRTYHNHHHYHHHIANKDLDHMLTYFGLTHLEVSLNVFAGFFCPLVYSCLLSSVIYHETFCLYVATIFFVFLYFIQNWSYVYSSCNFCACFLICSSVPCCFHHIFHLCCYSSCVSCLNVPIFTLEVLVYFIILILFSLKFSVV